MESCSSLLSRGAVSGGGAGWITDGAFCACVARMWLSERHWLAFLGRRVGRWVRERSWIARAVGSRVGGLGHLRYCDNEIIFSCRYLLPGFDSSGICRVLSNRYLSLYSVAVACCVGMVLGKVGRGACGDAMRCDAMRCESMLCESRRVYAILHDVVLSFPMLSSTLLIQNERRW